MKNLDQPDGLQVLSSIEILKKNHLLILYDFSKWFNVIIITVITLFGIYGNLVSIKIFTCYLYKNVKPLKYYLILLSMSDLSVLLTHYVDFTFRSWVNLLGIYSTKFNFVDKYNFFCKLVPYLRNVFKTLSVYCLVFMTLHRLVIIYFPMIKSRLSSAKFNKQLLASLVVASFVANFGILFINSTVLHQENDEYFCSIQPVYIKLNLYCEIIFVLFTIIIPSIFFLIFSLVLFKKISALYFFSRLYKNTFFCVSKNIDKVIKSNQKKVGFSIRTTYVMILLSKWFVLLHVPYFVTWFVFYIHLNYKSGVNNNSLNESETFLSNPPNRILYLKSFLNFTEILFSFNYSINFLLYLINGPLFRKIYKRMHRNFLEKFWAILCKLNFC